MSTHISKLYIYITLHIVSIIAEPSDSTWTNSRRRVLVSPSTLSISDKQTILDLHNTARSEVASGTFVSTLARYGSLPSAANMNELLWDPELEQLAINVASKCDSSHSDVTTANLSTDLSKFQLPATPVALGENLAFSSDNPPLFDTIIDLTNLWISEGYFYAYNTIMTNNSDTQCNASANLPTNGCGHFTQIIWANTRYIGCGFFNCNETFGTNFVCLYYTAGNVHGQTPYNIGTVCDECTDDRDVICDMNSLCGGGVDSSYDIDSTTDTDDCDNGLGLTLSAVCGITKYYTTTIEPKSTIAATSSLISSTTATADAMASGTTIVIPTQFPTTQPTPTPTPTPTPVPTKLLPDQCESRCDAFSVIAEDYKLRGNNVCITYKISRLFSNGLCKKSVKYAVLGVCDGDILSSRDLSGLIHSFDVMKGSGGRSSSSDSDSSTSRYVWGTSSNNKLSGIRINYVVSKELVFELCLRHVFLDDLEFSKMVRLKRGKNKIDCDSAFLDGLPCLDLDKWSKSGYGSNGYKKKYIKNRKHIQNGASLQNEESDNETLSMLSRLDPYIGYSLLSILVAFVLLMGVAGYICVYKKRNRETIYDTDDGIMETSYVNGKEDSCLEWQECVEFKATEYHDLNDELIIQMSRIMDHHH